MNLPLKAHTIYFFILLLFVFSASSNICTAASFKQFGYKTISFNSIVGNNEISLSWEGDIISNCADYESKTINLFFTLLNERGDSLEIYEVYTLEIDRLGEVRLGIDLEVEADIWEKTYSVDIYACEVGDAECKAAIPPLASYAEPVSGMEFILIKGGDFSLGGVVGAKSFEGAKEVTLEDFYIGKYEVTQAQWEKFMGNNPSHFKGENNPVEKVSWNDVQEFIKRLNSISGEEYRLPSESEWEYAARSGGKQQKWAGTNDLNSVHKFAWDAEASGGATHPVGEKEPNDLGLFDMSGNVWEWCQSIYTNKRGADIQQPPKGGNGSPRVIRGGSWFSTRRFVLTTFRIYSWPSISTEYLGFRLVKPLSHPLAAEEE